MKLKRKVPAYNLQELLVVLVIIGILILIAMPNFMGLINRAKSVEAQQNLKAIHSLQKNHFYMYSSYTLEFNKIDFTAPKTTKEGGTANYTYQIIEASGNTFKAQAVAINDSDGDGNKSTWEIDENGIPEEVIKD